MSERGHEGTLRRLLSRLRPRRSNDSAQTRTLPFADIHFDVAHVFRLIAVQSAQPYLSASARGEVPRRHLDLDDIESRTHHRIAELYRQNGRLGMGAREDAEAEMALARETEVLRDFNRVYVCSEEDREEILGRSSTINHGVMAEVCVLPNAVRVAEIGPPAWEGAPFIFLFVGTLAYYPNEDGLRYFCTRVLPLIRRDARIEVEVNVVGAGSLDGVMTLARLPGVQLIGEVPEIEPHYHRAHAVVVPVRAGGGTRIKVLEAFGYRRPVVSTSIGIEGIAVRNEEHLLLADTPEEFARQCLRLMDEPALRERLASNAFALLTRSYTPEAVARTAASCVSPPS